MSLNLIINEQEDQRVIRLSAALCIDKKPLEMWFEVPVGFKSYLTDLADPFLLAVLFPAMKANLPIKIVNRKVSETLLRNIYEVQRAWSQWYPEQYHCVAIEADSINEPSKDGVCALAAFTGGIDGAFVLWDNLLNRKNPFPYKVAAALYVHGFHIPLREKEASEKIAGNLRYICDELQIELIDIRCNLRRFGNWYDYHGTALAACLSLFSGFFNLGIIGSSHPYAYLRFPWGSNPITDRLLSSHRISIINYGAGTKRLEKIEALQRWDRLQQVVNVCIRNYGDNCGRCEKCIRTLLAYKAVGAPIPDTFRKKEPSLTDIVFMRAFQPQELRDYQTILKKASENKKTGLWYIALSFNILFNRLLKVSRILHSSNLIDKILTRVKKNPNTYH